VSAVETRQCAECAQVRPLDEMQICGGRWTCDDCGDIPVDAAVPRKQELTAPETTILAQRIALAEKDLIITDLRIGRADALERANRLEARVAELEQREARAAALVEQLGAVLQPIVEQLPLERQLEASVPWISLANLLGRPQPRVACAGKLPRLALVR
jgi:hypothetical protein